MNETEKEKLISKKTKEVSLGEADGIRITCSVCGIERAGNFWDHHLAASFKRGVFHIKIYACCACGATFKVAEENEASMRMKHQ